MVDIKDVLEEYDLDDDFGFTAISEDEYNEVIQEAAVAAAEQAEDETVSAYKEKLSQVERLILPFLIKLLKAEETYIKWPPEVRKPTIEKQIEKILAITRS